MLVLSRERDETIMIGDDIEITIVDIRGDKIRIGINAPSRIAVHRKEVYDAIRAENREAANLAKSDPSALDAGVPVNLALVGTPRVASGPERRRAMEAGGLRPGLATEERGATEKPARMPTPAKAPRPGRLPTVRATPLRLSPERAPGEDAQPPPIGKRIAE